MPGRHRADLRVDQPDPALFIAAGHIDPHTVRRSCDGIRTSFEFDGPTDDLSAGDIDAHEVTNVQIRTRGYLGSLAIRGDRHAVWMAISRQVGWFADYPIGFGADDRDVFRRAIGGKRKFAVRRQRD